MNTTRCTWPPRVLAVASVLTIGATASVALAQDSALYVLGKTVRYEQTSTAAPSLLPTATLPWGVMVGLMGVEEGDYTAVTVTRPGFPTEPLQWLPDDEEWGLGEDPRFATKAEMNAEVPDSATAYTMTVTPAGGSAIAAQLVLNGDAFPAAPRVANFAAAQSVDSTQAFTLAWDAFAGGTAADFVLVSIEVTNGRRVFATPMPEEAGALTGTATSVEIPAGTLAPNQTYECEITFINVVDRRTGVIPGAVGYAFYDASTELTLAAAALPEPKLFLLAKSAGYSQTSAAAPSMVPAERLPWSGMLPVVGFAADDFSGIQATRPGFAPVALVWSAERGEWSLPQDAEFETKAELDAEFPNSTSPYTLAFSPSGGGAPIVASLVLNGDAYPAAPHVANHGAAQAIEPAQPFTLTWDAFVGGTAADVIMVFVSNSQGNDIYSSAMPGSAGALDGTATSFAIPAGTFQAGRTYSCEITFFNVVDTETGVLPGTLGFAAYAASTSCGLRAAGTAVGPEATELSFSFSVQNIQVVSRQPQITYPLATTFSAVFTEYGDPAAPDSVTITGPTGSHLESGVQTQGWYTMDNDARGYPTPGVSIGTPPAAYPPGGAYSVNYGGTVIPLNVAAPDAANRQVVAVPVFTVDGSGNLTHIAWSYRTTSGAAASAPANVDYAYLSFQAGGNNWNFSATGLQEVDVGPVAWSTVQWVDIGYTDTLGNQYRSSFNVVHHIAPEITTSPVAQTITAGGSITLSVVATGDPAPTYQWQLDGVDIQGATGSTYVLPSAQSFHAGSYRVVVTNAGGSRTSNAATVTVNAAPPSNSRLLNLSTRALCRTGDDVLIPGFVVDGSGTKQLLIRAVGPTLGVDPFNLAGVLPNPQLTLKRMVDGAYQDFATNNDWGTNDNATAIRAAAARVWAFALGEGSTDAALLVDLPVGQYTVTAADTGSNTGIAIVEFYDAGETPGNAKLVNLSNRGYVGLGDQIMIPGVIISDEGPKTLLIRAVGPGLAQFGVGGLLANPRVDIYRSRDGGSDRLLTNDNWGSGADAVQTAATAAQVFAFPLQSGSADAAFVITLPAGAYTVQASGVGETTGVVLVEVYLVP